MIKLKFCELARKPNLYVLYCFGNYEQLVLFKKYMMYSEKDLELLWLNFFFLKQVCSQFCSEFRLKVVKSLN